MSGTAVNRNNILPKFLAEGRKHMDKSTLLYQFLRFALVTAGVCLFFRYLLPLLFPFLLAYVLIRLLYPVMNFLHDRLKLPRFLSHYGTLLAFLTGVTGILLVIIWKLISQLRLLFCNFPVYHQILSSVLSKQTERFCHCIDYYFNLENGTVLGFCEKQLQQLEESSGELLTTQAGKTLLNCVSGSFHFLAVIAIVIISMLILVKEIEPLHKTYRNSSFFQPVHFVLSRLKEGGLTYLKAEGIIIIINWIVCSFGLFLIHNPYFFLIGMGIAIFDAFPVLGSGMIFVPWSLYEFLNQHYYAASILITAYLITLFVREFLEAKLIGKGLGFNPFLMIASIFIGIKLFGVSGILLGPLALVLIQGIIKLDGQFPVS